jgi:uncharacterized coiled-coil protein SlyX
MTAEDVTAFVRLLAQDPQAQQQVREMLLLRELQRIDAALARLAEAQAESAERLTHLEDRMARVEAVLEQLVVSHAEANKRLTRVEAALEVAGERLSRVEAAIMELATVQKFHEERLARLQGHFLEAMYRDKCGAHFGPLLRRARVVPTQSIEDDLEAALSAREMDDVCRLDLLIAGQPRRRPDAAEVWLAVEVSATVDRHDVARAIDRSALLRRAGMIALPVVAGEDITRGAEAAAGREQVVVLQDGNVEHWDEALARYAAA